MKIVDIATAECGYLEKKSNAQLDDKTANAGNGNYTKYWRDIYPAFQAQAWCVCFIVWCARQAGYSEDIIPSLYSCTNMRDWYTLKNRWYTRTQGAAPGDFVIFGDTSGKPSHIGLVSMFESGKIHTIEGNTSSAAGVVANGGCVAAKSYDATYIRILGYCRPNYPVEVPAPDPDVPSAWAKDAWTWAKSLGITDGTSPQGSVTREQVATMLYRYNNLK